MVGGFKIKVITQLEYTELDSTQLSCMEIDITNFSYIHKVTPVSQPSRSQAAITSDFLFQSPLFRDSK